MRSLEGLNIVEFGGSVAGAYCAKLFADHGASVAVVGNGRLTEHQSRYMHARTQSRNASELDWSGVDVVIESEAPDPLATRDLNCPQAIRVQLSPFGCSGPRAQWKGTDLTDYAISGHAYLYGDPDREPLKGPPDQPAVAAGLFGFIGAMAALFARPTAGPQTVDVSHVQTMVALHQMTLLRWQLGGQVLCRMGNRYTGQGQPNGLYECRDGWVAITCVTDVQIETLLSITGLKALLELPSITSAMDFQLHPELLDDHLVPWLAAREVTEVVDLLQTVRVPAAPALDPLTLLDDPQLIERQVFEPLDDGSGHLVPRPPCLVSNAQAPAGGAWASTGPLPLAGLRVLDLARVWAGPLCARILSDLGADVIWIEGPSSRGPKEIPDSVVQAAGYYAGQETTANHWNRSGHYVKYSLGKRSLVLDLQNPAGQDVLARLLPTAHVLIENFSTRVMPQLGFDEQRLHELNPDLVYVTMPGYGRSGPAENWLAYGSCIDSHAALSSLIGYRDESPWKGGIAWPDPIAGLHACSSTLAALWASTHHGVGGVTIESAQLESTVAAIGDRILEAQADAPLIPDGNRKQGFLAQGVYRCRGEDDWIAISLPTAEQWEALATFAGMPPSLGTSPLAIDRALSQWTVARDPTALAEALQEIGIPAAPVTTAPGVLDDPHLAARDAWVTVDQPEIGSFTAPLTPIALSATPLAVRSPAPTFGQHNSEVLADAGFSPAEIDGLAAAGVIVTEPPA